MSRRSLRSWRQIVRRCCLALWLLAAGVAALGWPESARAVDYNRIIPGGQFRNPGLWTPFDPLLGQFGPGGTSDTVNFNLGRPPENRYTVTDVSGDNSRMLVHNDSLALDIPAGAVYSLVNTSDTNPSVTVGVASGHEGDVLLTGAGLLEAQHSSIGHAAGSIGVVTVDGLRWTNSGDLQIGDASTGTLAILGGGSVTSVGSASLGQAGTGTATIAGENSQWIHLGTLTAGVGIASPGGSPGHGTLTIVDGGRLENSSATIGVGDAFDNGLFIVQAPGTATVTVAGPGSTWTNSGNLTVGVTNVGMGTLTIQNSGLVDVGQTLAVGDSGIVNLEGGTLRLNGYSGSGVFNHVSGTIQLTGDRIVGTDTAIADLFGATPIIANGKGLTIEGAATIQADLILSGGTLRTEQLLDGGGQFHWAAGTLHITGGVGLTIQPAGIFGSTMVLNQNQTLEVNHALVVDGGATLMAAGRLKAGSAVVNAGSQLFASGAMHDFGTRLTNQGDLVLSNTTIDGPVTNTAGANITAIDNVTFNDLVDGPGGFFGPGTITFAGGMSPGASAAAVTFECDVALAHGNTLFIELGGTERGTQYDALQIGGTAALGGTLAVSLLDSFTPAVGDTFEIISATGAITGTFTSQTLPALAGDVFWSVNYGTNTVTLAVAAPGGPGDYNGDGTVDAADYVVWRKNDGTPEGYNTWRGNFGNMLSGSSSARFETTNAAVPEPPLVALLVTAAMVASVRRALQFHRPSEYPRPVMSD